VSAIGYDTNFVYNWDNKLRHAEAQYNTIDLKYDPMGNRVYKASSTQGTRKYIVDISGGLPTILLEIDPCTSSLKKTYVYANGEILAQHDGDVSVARYFYLNDCIIEHANLFSRKRGKVPILADKEGSLFVRNRNRQIIYPISSSVR
jgi:hypothetical protein